MMLRHAGELLCLTMYNYADFNRPDTITLSNGNPLRFGIDFYNEYVGVVGGVPDPTIIQAITEHRTLLNQYIQTYLNTYRL